MAGAAVSFLVPHPLVPSTKRCCSQLSPTNLMVSHFAFRPSFLHINYKRFNGSSFCSGKPNASSGRENEGLGEVFFDGDEEMEDESEDDDSDSSVDLLFKFMQSIFRNISKRAKKATRSILPYAISPQLVSFAVDGVLLLTSLSIVRALLEVICSLGGAVFFVILLLRVVWMLISHFQSNGSSFNQGGSSYGTAQPSS